jgi:hypothetical protein
MKRVAIMQPYFLPYVGYFQLIGAADLFIVYDNIKYTKKGWINRNRFLRNGKEAVFSLPLKSDSDSLDVRDREIAADFQRPKLLNKLREAYRSAPHFDETFPLVERIVLEEERNLFRVHPGPIRAVCGFLGIGTEIVASSSLPVDHTLQGEARVVALCRHARADVYINAIGGRDLYSKEDFGARGIVLKFLRPKPFEYRQFGGAFIPWLSIVDVLMFNSPDTIQERLASGYELI